MSISGFNWARRRRQNPPHQLREFQPAAHSFGLRNADAGTDPAHRRFLERRLIRSGRSAAQLFMEFRRRSNVDRSQSVSHLQRTPVSIKPGSPCRTA